MKRIIATALALTLAIGCLAGCQKKQKPKTPEELGTLITEVMKDIDNFRMGMDLNANIQINATADMDGTALNMELGLPIGISMETAIAGNDQHTNMEMNMNLSLKASADGESQTQEQEVTGNTEMYVVQDGKTSTTYTRSWDQDSGKDEAQWFKSTDEDTISDLTNILDSENFWKLATMEKKDGNYTLTFKLADLLNDEEVRKALTDSELLDLDDEELDMEQISEVLGDAVLIITADGDNFQLQSATLTGFTVGTALTDMVKDLCDDLLGVEFDDLNIVFDIDWSISFSDYGKVPTDEVQVSDDVIDQASEENPDDFDFDWDDSDEPIGTDPIDPGVSAGTLTVEKLLDIQMDGTALSFPADMAELEALGWTIETDEYDSFYVMKNSDSDYEDCDFYVSLLDIHGLDQLDFEAYDTAKHPDFSIADIHFGMTYTEVFSLIGSPYYVYTDGDYFSAYFEIVDYNSEDDADYELEIYMEAPKTADGFDYDNAVVCELTLYRWS